MRVLTGLAVMLAGLLSVAGAANIEAGRSKAAAVCADLHGALGTSVSDSIPNLAGQKTRYIEVQLTALKDGSRKNPIMNAIAGQLSSEDIANLAAHFSAQPGAGSMAKSEFLPNLVKTGVTFPESYKTTFTKYHTINFPDTKQVRYYYANAAALQAAKAGKSLPDGSVLFAEVYSAKQDSDEETGHGRRRILCPGARGARDRPSAWRCRPAAQRGLELRRIHDSEGGAPGVNQAECLACHKPLDKVSYTFTLKQLTDVAKAN